MTPEELEQWEREAKDAMGMLAPYEPNMRILALCAEVKRLRSQFVEQTREKMDAACEGIKERFSNMDDLLILMNQKDEQVAKQREIIEILKEALKLNSNHSYGHKDELTYEARMAREALAQVAEIEGKE